jgi:hypothetical protein
MAFFQKKMIGAWNTAPFVAFKNLLTEDSGRFSDL